MTEKQSQGIIHYNYDIIYSDCNRQIWKRAPPPCLGSVFLLFIQFSGKMNQIIG